VATDAARDAAREAGGCTPRHSVGINLLTRFHRLALAAPRPSLSPSSSFPVRPFSVLFLLRLPSPLLLLLLVSSWLYDYLRQLCPSVRPSNPSPWNLGWHLVNRERRRHSPFCTNFGLPAASERARRKHHLRAGPPPPASRCLSLSLSLLEMPFCFSHSFQLARARDSSCLFSFSARARRIDYGSSPP